MSYDDLLSRMRDKVQDAVQEAGEKYEQWTNGLRVPRDTERDRALEELEAPRDFPETMRQETSKPAATVAPVQVRQDLQVYRNYLREMCLLNSHETRRAIAKGKLVSLDGFKTPYEVETERANLSRLFATRVLSKEAEPRGGVKITPESSYDDVCHEAALAYLDLRAPVDPPTIARVVNERSSKISEEADEISQERCLLGFVESTLMKKFSQSEIRFMTLEILEAEKN